MLTHPFVIGELAMGSLRDRALIIAEMSELSTALVAEDQEVLSMIERHRIHSRGIGYLDPHLLASARLTRGATLWTRDRRLHIAADELGLAANLPERRLQ